MQKVEPAGIAASPKKAMKRHSTNTSMKKLRKGSEAARYVQESRCTESTIMYQDLSSQHEWHHKGQIPGGAQTTPADC